MVLTKHFSFEIHSNQTTMVHLYQCGVTRVSSSFARWMRHRLCVYTQNVADSHALEACEKLRVLLVIVRQLDKDIFYSCWTKLAYQVVAQFYHLSTCINFLVWVISSICSFCWYLLPATPETHPIGSHSLSWIHSPSWHWASPSAKHVHCYLGSTSPADSSMHLMSDGVWYFFITTAHR